MTPLVLLLFAAAPKVVSPEWKVVNVKQDLAEFYAQQLSESLRSAGLQVATAQDIRSVLDLERQKQLTGCSEGSSACMAELANALGCDATLTVNLARFDDGSFRGIAKLLKASDGSVLASATLDAKSERGLLDSIEAAGRVLSAPLLERQGSAAPSVTSRGGAHAWWWVPGVTTVLAGGAGAVLLGIAQQQYTVVQNPASSDEHARAAVNDGKTFQSAGWALVGVAGVSLAATAVLWFWHDDAAVHPLALLTPTGGFVGVAGSWP